MSQHEDLNALRKEISKLGVDLAKAIVERRELDDKEMAAAMAMFTGLATLGFFIGCGATILYTTYFKVIKRSKHLKEEHH